MIMMKKPILDNDLLRTFCKFLVLAALLFSYKAWGQEGPYTEKELLSPRIYSRFAETNPIISADGQTLYFNRRNHPENIAGRDDSQDIWVTRRYADEQWAKPRNAGETINSPDFDALCSLSPDGNLGVFFNTYKKKNLPIAISRRDQDGNWDKPIPVKIDNYYNYNEYSGFHHSFLENVLFLAIEREDSRGEQDIYISLLKDDGSYTEPENLGKMINTKKSDFAPFLGHDNRSLFFASYGHEGYGGADLYVSYRLDSTWKNWSAPINLGPYINTPNDETYISITKDFKYMFFDSHGEDSTTRDLYMAKTPIEFNPFERPYARR
jgi:hypothetical protein